MAGKRSPLGAWQALIKLPNGRRMSRSFSILKFGRERAFRRAKEARAQMLTPIEEQPYLKAETAKRLAAKKTEDRQGGG